MSYKTKLKALTMLTILSLSACEQMPALEGAVGENPISPLPDKTTEDVKIRNTLGAAGLIVAQDDTSGMVAVQIMNFIVANMPANTLGGGDWDRDVPETVKNMLLGHGYGVYSGYRTMADFTSRILSAYGFHTKIAVLYDVHYDSIVGVEVETSDMGDIGLMPYFNAAFTNFSGSGYVSFSSMVSGTAYTIEVKAQPVWAHIGAAFASFLQSIQYQGFN